MKKKSTPNDDYKSLKFFLDCHFDWYAPRYPTTPSGSPSQFLEKIEETSLANAKKGLNMALNDIAEDSVNWTPEEIAAADARFLAAGTFTLSEIRRRYSKKYLQVLKRGAIRTEVEYYLLKGILDGGGEIDAVEKEQIESLLTAFEAKVIESVKQK